MGVTVVWSKYQSALKSPLEKYSLISRMISGFFNFSYLLHYSSSRGDTEEDDISETSSIGFSDSVSQVYARVSKS